MRSLWRLCVLKFYCDTKPFFGRVMLKKYINMCKSVSVLPSDDDYLVVETCVEGDNKRILCVGKLYLFHLIEQLRFRLNNQQKY